MNKKELAINEEVRTAYTLINQGLIVLMEMKENANHFHLPLFLISNGLERLMKCILLFDYHSENKKYPNDKKYFKRVSEDRFMSGHELDILFDSIKKIYKKNAPFIISKDIKEDLRFINTNYLPNKLLKLLSQFATETRYHNLNLLLGAKNVTLKSPEIVFLNLLKEIQKNEFPELNSENYKIFDLCIREVFISIIKITRFLSAFFLNSNEIKSLYFIKESWMFIKYNGDPKLDLDKYKK
jgi:hypothetical protein